MKIAIIKNKVRNIFFSEKGDLEMLMKLQLLTKSQNIIYNFGKRVTGNKSIFHFLLDDI